MIRLCSRLLRRSFLFPEESNMGKTAMGKQVLPKILLEVWGERRGGGKAGGRPGGWVGGWAEKRVRMIDLTIGDERAGERESSDGARAGGV